VADGPRLTVRAAWYEGAARAAARFLLIMAALVVLGFGIVALRVALLPITFAIVIASVLSGPMQWLLDRRVRPAVASLIVIALLAAVLIAAAWLAIRSVAAEWNGISGTVSAGLDTAEQQSQQHLGLDPEQTAATRDWAASIADTLATVAVAGVIKLIPAGLELVSAAFLTAIVLFFVLKDGPRLWQWASGQFPRQQSLLDQLGTRVWRVLAQFMRGTTIIATIDAVGIGLGMWLLGVPYAGAIAILTFLLAYIPMIGATISGAFGVVLALAEGGIPLAIAALLVVLAVQQIEGNLLQPVIMGRAVRLHPLAVALALVLGFTYAGILGMFLAVPLTAATAAVINELRNAGVFADRIEFTR